MKAEPLDQGLDALEKLRVFSPAVYTLDDQLTFDPLLPLTIAVHPYFLHDDEHRTDYPQRRDQFLALHRGPVLILAEEDSLEESVMAVYGCGHVPQRYFMMTEIQNPDPSEMSWSDLYHLVKQFQGPVDLIGGFLNTARSSVERGCLGYFGYHLRRNGIKANYIPDLTFSNSNVVFRWL